MDKAQEIADLKKKLALPSLPESAKEKLREKLATLEASSEGDSGQREDKSQEIADIKKKLALPSLPESAKEKLREKLNALEGEPKKKDKPKPKPKPKPKKEVKPIPSKVVRKSVKDKPERKVIAKKSEESIDDKIASVKKELEKAEQERGRWIAEAKTGRGIESRGNTTNRYTRKIDVLEAELKKLREKKNGTANQETKKQQPKKRGRKPLPKVEKPKAEPQKRGRKPKVQTPAPKPAPAPKKVVAKKTYVPKVKTAKGEPDCDTLLKQFRARRRKAKEVQAKRKTTPVFRKIASDVVDAVEKAIKNVPAKTIKESPKETIKKFGMLKKSAEQFLSAFRGILGKEYARSEAEKELSELKSLIDKLIKKYKK